MGRAGQCFGEIDVSEGGTQSLMSSCQSLGIAVELLTQVATKSGYLDPSATFARVFTLVTESV